MGYHCKVLERTFAFSRLSPIWTGSGASSCDALDLQLVATTRTFRLEATTSCCHQCSPNGNLACRVAELSPVRIGSFVPFTIISGGITDRAVKLNSKFVQRCQGHSCDRIFPSRMARTAFTQIVRAGIALNRFCRDKSWYPQPSGRCHERQPLPPSDSTCQEGRSLGATHEQSSLPAFTAATYGRLTGKPGVYMSTLGPGLLHFCFISKFCLSR